MLGGWRRKWTQPSSEASEPKSTRRGPTGRTKSRIWSAGHQGDARADPEQAAQGRPAAHPRHVPVIRPGRDTGRDAGRGEGYAERGEPVRGIVVAADVEVGVEGVDREPESVVRTGVVVPRLAV